MHKYEQADLTICLSKLAPLNHHRHDRTTMSSPPTTVSPTLDYNVFEGSPRARAAAATQLARREHVMTAPAAAITPTPVREPRAARAAVAQRRRSHARRPWCSSPRQRSRSTSEYTGNSFSVFFGLCYYRQPLRHVLIHAYVVAHVAASLPVIIRSTN